MTRQRFKCLEPICLLAFAKGLCMCFWACFLLQRTSMSERLGSFHIFLGIAHSPEHAHGFLDSSLYIGGLSKPPITFCFQFFLISFILFYFFGSYFCYPQLILSPQAAAMLNNCCWFFFLTITLGIGLFAQSEFWVWSCKDKPWKWRFSGSLHTGQIVTIILG